MNFMSSKNIFAVRNAKWYNWRTMRVRSVDRCVRYELTHQSEKWRLEVQKRKKNLRGTNTWIDSARYPRKKTALMERRRCRTRWRQMKRRGGSQENKDQAAENEMQRETCQNGLEMISYNDETDLLARRKRGNSPRGLYWPRWHRSGQIWECISIY